MLGGGFYFFGMPLLFPPEPPPPPVATKPKPATPPPVATAPAVPSSAATKPAAAAPAPAPATPSETLNNLAHAPVNAINKAQDAVAARRQSGQANIDAIVAGQEPPAKAPPAAVKPAVNASASLAPGISATTSDVEAVAESTPAFRAYVANAKVTSVIGGPSPKIFINNRMIRAGEVADAGLGITFDTIDPEKKLLIFKDKTGAVVTKRY